MQAISFSFFIFFLIFVFIGFMFLFMASSIKVLREWDRAVVLRLGKFYGIRGPGIIWVTSILDKVVATISLKIQQTKIDTREYVSSDGSTNRLKVCISWRIVDVEMAILSVENYRESIFNVANHHVEKIAKSFP